MQEELEVCHLPYLGNLKPFLEEGFHLGDLSWDGWQTYLYGCPEGGGQYVQKYIIGRVPDDAWVRHDTDDDDDDDY